MEKQVQLQKLKSRGKRSMLKLGRQTDRQRERERERDERKIKGMTWGTKVRKISQTQIDRTCVHKINFSKFIK